VPHPPVVKALSFVYDPLTSFETLEFYGSVQSDITLILLL